MKQEQEKAKELIGKLAPWGNHDFTEQEWLAYFHCAEYLQQLGEHDLIQLLENIQQEYTSQADGDKVQSKLFILLRVLFDIPLSGNVSSRRSFKGWENWPMESETNEVNLSWPIAWIDNKPHLESNYEGSLGKPYALVSEYTYFKNLYRFRNSAY